MTTTLKRGMIEPGFATAAQVSGIGDIFVGLEAEFSFIPSDPWWLPKFGQLLNVADYPVLAAKIGTLYGGDGITNFRLPDDRGRVSAGLDNMGGVSANRLTNQTGGLNGDTLGAAGGNEVHTLLLAQMPTHKHDVAVSASGQAGTYSRSTYNLSSSGRGSVNGNSGDIGAVSDPTSVSVTTDVTESNKGSGAAHNNVQPTIIKCKCILAYWPV